MPIVTFLGSGKEQVGKTLSIVAIATNMAIEYNKKILVISASYNNDTLKKCYWSENSAKKGIIFKPKVGIEIDNGIEGLAKIVESNKVTPSLITDYTKVIFKDRLEILLGFDNKQAYNTEGISKIYAEIVNLSGQYYDMVLVDLDNEISGIGVDTIIEKSDLIVAMSSQKISSVNAIREKVQKIPHNKIMFLIGKYDRKSKYTVKNITRSVEQKKEVLAIPYNTLYFEAAEEGTVTDLFLRLRRIEDKNDNNYFFIEQVKNATNEIDKKIRENELMK